MDLLSERWINVRTIDGVEVKISAFNIGQEHIGDITAPRPDFRGAMYQFLIGLLQTTFAPEDLDEWRERLNNPPSTQELEQAFGPYRHAFLLENDGPAFMQDFALPIDSDRIPISKLLIDLGSKPNLHFNKLGENFSLCETCCAQALLVMQLNAPPGGSGTRTSVRGSRGPLTTLLLPEEKNSSLWAKLWVNVLPSNELGFSNVKTLGDVLPWLTETRTSDGSKGVETFPESVHELQVYWSMPRRIRLDFSDTVAGECSCCGNFSERLISCYRNRHGGTNYVGNWLHPLTPYYLDANGEKPPYPGSGEHARRGYREWIGLVLGNDEHRPDAAKCVSNYTARRNVPKTRLWCFGYSMNNMTALCWYESYLPVYRVLGSHRNAIYKNAKIILDSAEWMSKAINERVKMAWSSRPPKKSEPAVTQSFWQGSEPLFYQILEQLSRLDFEEESELGPIYQAWLHLTRQLAMSLFDYWVLSGSVEDMDLQRVVKARADLAKDLNIGKAMKPLWDIVNQHKKEKV